ncbi:MAG: DUF4369 domain-containing protein [Bacteroidales bacterium]|nr:DUF4369 domain-containing protein [Bacteroidales bacterium]
MKRIIFTLIAGAALLTSCSQNKEYVIHGTVADPNLEGAKIYLVPLENATVETIDSVYVENQAFEFRGTEEKIADLRIERRRRLGMQNLLVITEPGEIYVTIGRVSNGGGTAQNDSLQVWKELTKEYHQTSGDLIRAGKRGQVKAVREAYVARTRQMAENVGHKSTLGIFLNGRFKETREK